VKKKRSENVLGFLKTWKDLSKGRLRTTSGIVYTNLPQRVLIVFENDAASIVQRLLSKSSLWQQQHHVSFILKNIADDPMRVIQGNDTIVIVVLSPELLAADATYCLYKRIRSKYRLVRILPIRAIDCSFLTSPYIGFITLPNDRYHGDWLSSFRPGRLNKAWVQINNATLDQLRSVPLIILLFHVVLPYVTIICV
jgi:hypothetical protein